MQTDISIVVCTYNRCKSLNVTLDSLLDQNINGSCEYEIIVVDNNSTDQTKEVVEGYLSKFEGRLRYTFEFNQGLSFARNKGIQEAKGSIVAFTDDDTIVDQKWVQTIYVCAKEIDFDALGGRIMPVYPSNTPSWVKNNADLLCGPVLCHDYGEETKEYTQPMTPIFGANMAFKREIFEKYGMFRTDLGAGRGTMGEDTEFVNRLSKDSKKIYYCGKALVWHPAITERMSLGYIARWNIDYGKYCVVKEDGVFDKSIISYRGIPRYLFRRIPAQAFKLVFSCFNRRKFLTHWVSLFRDIGTTKAYRKYHLSMAQGD